MGGGGEGRGAKKVPRAGMAGQGAREGMAKHAAAARSTRVEAARLAAAPGVCFKIDDRDLQNTCGREEEVKGTK